VAWCDLPGGIFCCIWGLRFNSALDNGTSSPNQ
jgi:hypothetical protein